MPTTKAGNGRLLIVGATGHLGGKVARQALARGHQVRALVRPSSDAGHLERQGIEVARGDLLDIRSLRSAMLDCIAVVSTAIGYSNRKPGDLRAKTDTQGNTNLADAALAVALKRVVFCSVLTCDKARAVPHFWHKKLAENCFKEKQVPFVSLRPGAFLDQGPSDFWASGLRKGHLRFLANPDVPFTFVHTDDLAGYLLDACDSRVENGSIIDIGCDRPVSIRELAEIMSRQLERRISPAVPPWFAVKLALRVSGIFDPSKRDLLAMMSYIQEGGYVADTSAQEEHFGIPVRIEEAVSRYLDEVGLSKPSFKLEHSGKVVA